MALECRFARVSATTEPTPASSTIISSSSDSATEEMSQRSEKSGSRVVRLMKTSPWVRKAAAMAGRARVGVMSRSWHGSGSGVPDSRP